MFGVIMENTPKDDSVSAKANELETASSHFREVYEAVNLHIRRKVSLSDPFTSCARLADLTAFAWQFDRRLLPIVCCLYILSYLDRGNIGNAKAAGAKSKLGLSKADWLWVLNCFYSSQVAFEWTNLFWKILPASKYVAVLCVL